MRALTLWSGTNPRYRTLVIIALILLAVLSVFRVHRATCKVDVNEMIRLAAFDPNPFADLGPIKNASGERIDWTKPVLGQAPDCCRLVRVPTRHEYNDWYINYMAYYEVEFLRSNQDVQNLYEEENARSIRLFGRKSEIDLEFFRVYGAGVFGKCGELLETYNTGA